MISKENVRAFNLYVVVFNFIRVAFIRRTIASAVMDVNRYYSIFALFRLCMFRRPITYLYVVFLVRDNVSRVVIYRYVRFIVDLFHRLRMFSRVANDLHRTIRTMMEFSTPMRNVNLNLTIMLAGNGELIGMISYLLGENVNGYLYARLRRCFLFHFRSTNAQVNGTFGKFRYHFMTTNVRVCLGRVITCRFNVLKIKRFIRRFLRGNGQLSRYEMKHFIGTRNVIVNDLFFCFRVNVKNNDLFGDRANFILFNRLRMKGSRVRMHVLHRYIINTYCFSRHLDYF